MGSSSTPEFAGPECLPRNAGKWLYAIMLVSDIVISPLYKAVGHGYARSHWTPRKIARPPHFDGGGAGRQHEQGSSAPQHIAARHFQIDRGPGNRRRCMPIRPQA